MKKEDSVIFLVYLFIGAAVTILGITGKNGFFDSGALVVMGFSLIVGSLGQLLRFWHSRKPENRESYETEMRRQRIEWDDERNRQIRHYAGYLTYAVTMVGCFTAAVIRLSATTALWSISTGARSTTRTRMPAAACTKRCTAVSP